MPTVRERYPEVGWEGLTWLTQRQAAEYLHVSPETVRRRANAGLIRRYGTGKGQSYLRRELDDYMKNKT